MAAISLLSMRFLHRQTFTNSYLGSWRRWKTTVDFSLVPKIQEVDLEEKFVRGSGPGGSAVNKNSNCVVLTHIPTGIVIKCHISRSLDENRKLARQLLISKLDEVYNQDLSIITQKKNIEKEKNLKSSSKRTKREQLKLAWKDREGIE